MHTIGKANHRVAFGSPAVEASVKLEIGATVTDEGKLLYDSPARVTAFLLPARGKRVEVTLERDAQRRSAQQNSRYWVAFVPFVAEMLAQRTGTPWSPDMAHDLCCRVFIGTITVEVGGEVHTFRKRSSKLNTVEFSQFSDKVERWIEEEWKINPDLIDSPEASA